MTNSSRTPSSRQHSRNRWIFFFSFLLSAQIGVAQAPPPAVVSSTQQLVVENRTGYDISVLYKRDGQYEFHVDLPDGQDMEQQTTPGFTWYFGANDSVIVTEYVTTNAAEQRLRLTSSMIEAAGLPVANRTRAPLQGSELPQQLPPPSIKKGPEVVNDIPDVVDFDEKAVVDDLDPIRGPLTEWYNFNKDAFSINTESLGFLTAGEGGQLFIYEPPKGTTPDTKSAWMATPVEGKKDAYYINNVYFYDNFLYADELAVQGSPLLLGTAGSEAATGEWRITKGETYTTISNVARPNLKIGVRGNTIALSSKQYQGQSAYAAEIAAHKGGDAWVVFTSEFYHALLSLVPSLTQMAENVRLLEEQEAERLAEIEKQKAKAAAAKAERARIAAIPKVNRSPGMITSRMGVGPIYDGKNGEKIIKYKLNESSAPEVLSINLNTSTDPNKSQYVDLVIDPEVTAWVKDGELYFGVKTNAQTTISLRHGNSPSKNFGTDGNFFVGHVRANLRFDAGREVLWSPTVQNKEVGFGSSTDVSKGINVSAEEIIGADLSESKGTNVNFQSREFEVTGVRGPGPQVIGSLQYEWDSCGLADKPKSTEPCTYEKPADLYDTETLALRKIPAIAQSLTGLETVSVFKNRFPASGLWSNVPIYLTVDVQLHAVKVVRSTKSNTKNKDWEDFKAGFTYVWRPDLWDTDKSFEEQHIIKEALEKPIGSTINKTFNIYLHANVDDLKPLMNSGF